MAAPAGARNVLVRLGKAAAGSRRQGRGGYWRGSALPVHPTGPATSGAIRVRIRQDMRFEDSGVELPGADPSADTAFKDVAKEVAEIQQRPIGHSIATRGHGTEAEAAIESKIAG